MALIDVAAREIYGKIVYYGPGRGGKTTNLRSIYAQLPAAAGRHNLFSIATATDRTLFFDVLPLDLGSVDGFRVRYRLYTVPGQSRSERTRIAVLTGADGVVFVADAQADRLADNRRSLDELADNIGRQGKRFLDYPLVMQYNKMDLPEALPAPILDRSLNPLAVPRFEAAAVAGSGVVETLRAICERVTRTL